MDRLFKNKLGDHGLPPSQEAWTKIESGLSKKNNTVIMWRAAAVFVLCGFLTGAWFYWQSTQDHTRQLATQQDDANTTVPETQEPLLKPVEKDENKNQAAIIKKSARTQREKVTASKNNEAVKEPIMKDAEMELTAVLETVSTEPVAKVQKPIVIEFTLDPIPSNTRVAQVTEEKNGLKKILDKAIDLKNGEGDLGGLRDAKNELFALDFKKDKTKRN